MLSAAVQTLLNTKSAFALSLVKKNEASFSIATGEIVVMEKEASEVKLPAATLNRIVAVICANAITSITVKAPAIETIFGAGFVKKATTITLTSNQVVVLEADGTNWNIIAGEPKREQAYGAESAAITESENQTPSTTRPTLVIGSVALKEASCTLTIGGVNVLVAKATTPEVTFPLSFEVLPAVKWAWSKSGAGTAVVKVSYLFK
jgi:hypothetical protein